MLYNLIKIIMRTGLRFFYRHIYVTGTAQIPARGPVIIIANHHASLMDAALLGILLRRRPWFFTRGDVFVNGPVRRILWWLHMIPVHGYGQGRTSLGANDDSFAAAQAILKRNGVIVFFPESTSHTERRLRPFRKGVFRLAFQTIAAQDFMIDIPIIPVGLSYDHPKRGRTSVQVHVGNALHTLAYIAQYRRQPAAALLRITKDAQERVLRQVLHVEDAERRPLAEQALEMQRNEKDARVMAWKIASREKLEREQAVCRHINAMTAAELALVQERHAAYAAALERCGLEDRTVAGTRHGKWKQWPIYMAYPLYLPGLLMNGLPVAMARRIADKRVYRTDFYSWIYVSCYCVLYLLWLALTVMAVALFGWRWAGIWALAMGVTGVFSYWYRERLSGARQYRRLKRLKAEQVEQLKLLRLAAQGGSRPETA